MIILRFRAFVLYFILDGHEEKVQYLILSKCHVKMHKTVRIIKFYILSSTVNTVKINYNI